MAQFVAGIVDHPQFNLVAEGDHQRSQRQRNQHDGYQQEGASAASPEAPALGRKAVGAAKALHEREHDAEAGKKAEGGGGENDLAGVELVIEDGGLDEVKGVSGQELLKDAARLAHKRGAPSTWATSVVMTRTAGKSMSIPE